MHLSTRYKTLFVKSKIICTLFASLKIFSTDMESIDIFKSFTVLFHLSMHHVRGTIMQATATMKDIRNANYPSELTHLYQLMTLDVFTFLSYKKKPCQRDCE